MAPCWCRAPPCSSKPKARKPSPKNFWPPARALKNCQKRRPCKHFPVLREGYAKRTFLDPHTGDLDVDLLHRGYLKLFKSRGGQLLNSAAAETI